MISETVVAVSPEVREIFFGVEVSFNSVIVEFDEDSQPFIMNDRVFLPMMRAIAEIAELNIAFLDGMVQTIFQHMKWL